MTHIHDPMKNTARPEKQEKLALKSTSVGQVSYLLAEKWLFTPNHRTIEYDGQLFTLRKKNADVLTTLVNFNNQIVTNEQLYQNVWQGRYASEGVIKRSICDLRNIFDDDDKSFIVTISKAGYKLTASVQEQVETNIQSDINNASSQAKLNPNPNQDSKVSAEPVDVTSDIESPTQPHQFRRFNNLFVMAATMVVTLVVCFSGFSYHQPEQPLNEVITHDVGSFLINELVDLTNDKSEAAGVLGVISQKLAAVDKKNPEYNNIALQLIGAYLHAGLHKEAIDINRMLIRDSETLYGVDDKRTLNVRHVMVDTLMTAGQTQSAFDYAQHTLELNLKYHAQDNALLANSYYHFSQVNLACFYPHCDRTDALRNGLESINKGIELLNSAQQLNTVAKADALLLKNWYIHEGETKVSLVTQALSIYLDKLGKFDLRSAEALLQLGKIEAIWFEQYEKAISHIKQSNDIVSLLFGENHYSVYRVKRDLARTYLTAGQYASAIEYLRQIEQPNGEQFSCKTKSCFNSLMMLAKAYLYSNDQNGAKTTVSQINLSLRSNALKVSFALSQELKAVVMRIDQQFDSIGQTPQQILATIRTNEGSGETSQNGVSVKIVTHELHNQLLHIAPQLIDSNRYIEIFSHLMQTKFSFYNSPPDKRFLAERALKSCENHSKILCQLVKNQLITKVIDT